jgi:hypothetical protein
MAWTKPTSITSWSFSRLKSYETCPLKLKLTAIDKLKEPQSPAMARGDGIHKTIEAFIKSGTSGRVPKELEAHAATLKDLRNRYKKARDTIVVEDTWAFKSDWTRTTWDDWSGCWLRVKLDVAYVELVGKKPVLRIIDWKSGKFSPQFNLQEYLDQLDLYGLGALLVNADIPDIEVIPQLYYTDAGVVYPPEGETKVYTHADFPRLKKAWMARAKPMLNDRQFAPKPNRWCSNCFFRKANKAAGGGQCVY